MHPIHCSGVNCVNILVAAGCDPTVRDNHGRTAHDYAIDKEMRKFIQTLGDAWSANNDKMPETFKMSADEWREWLPEVRPPCLY